MRVPTTLRPLAVAIAIAVGLVTFVPVAAAHGDDGRLEAVSVVPSGDTAVVTVRLTYENDSEPVNAATVTVAGEDGAGARLDPVAMTRTAAPGEYAATVTFPSAGTWNLRVTSVNPTATLPLTQEISADSGITTTPASTIGTTGETPTTATTGTVVSPQPSDAEKLTPPSDSASGAAPWIVGAVVVVVLIGAAAVVLRRRGGDGGDGSD